MHADINVTPLVDICLVLLIIFMVVTPMMTSGVPVKLPVAHTGSPVGDANRQLPIAVKEDGTLYFDATVIRPEQLADELAQRHAAHPDRPVVVRGDQHVRYGDVVAVLDACRKAGFADVGLVTSSPPAGTSSAHLPHSLSLRERVARSAG
jgi:biopolymer transport protein TolR